MKKEWVFKEEMTMWLRKNWSNPYTDETTLHCLANKLIYLGCISLGEETTAFLSPTECAETLVSVTKEKVRTWLMNMRTRHWRRCLREACENRRPAAILIEDSICIFDGKPLRVVLELKKTPCRLI